MKNLFTYFKSKDSSSSQPLPIKRVGTNINEPSTCPLKKSIDYHISNKKLDYLPGDICVIKNLNDEVDIPVIVDYQYKQCTNDSRIPVRRYNTSEIIWIDKIKDNIIEKIESKNIILEYFKKCENLAISSEFEEFLHIFDFPNSKRLELVLSSNVPRQNIDENSNDENDSQPIVTKTKKKCLFLNDSEDDIIDNLNSTFASETTTSNVLQMSKYSFQEEYDDIVDNETSLIELENTINKIKVESNMNNNTSMILNNFDYQHNHLDFLKDNLRKDKNGIPHYHPDSDRTTLYVPNSFFNSKEVTPVLKQWWKIKSDHFDTILLFKMGKFYETYHMDADIAVKELGLIYMRGSVAHAGFPEASFPQYASTLVQKGYKVARVEQTETPQMMNERIKSSCKGGSVKVVNREVCSILTPGTRIFDPFDVEIDANNVFTSTTINNNNCVVGFGMLAVIVDNHELSLSQTQPNEMGVCVLDSSTGQFYFGQFTDDCTLSQLRTMLASMPLPVAEVIIPKKVISSNVQSFITRFLSHARKEYTNEKIDSTQAILQLSNYFSACCDNSSKDDPTAELFSSLNLSNSESSKYLFALIAINYCLNYLKKNKIDRRIFSMKNFNKYIPKSTQNIVNQTNFKQKYMILDHNAITNLDILCNEDEIFNRNGSLIGLLDHCCTAFGRRLLPGLISQPLFCKKDIEERLCAVETLMNWEGKDEVRRQLRTLPDLDRLFFRIHANGNLLTNDDHPDNRAVIFNASLFNKKKVNDLLNALAGFSKLCDIVNMLKPLSDHSTLIGNLLDIKNETKCYFNTKQTVDYFQNAFNMIEAKENGIIIPKAGVLMEYDQTIGEIEELQKWFEHRLEELKKQLAISNLQYWNSGKIRYYIELPESAAKKLPSTFIYKSQRKGYCRYALEELEDQVAVLIHLEEKRDKLLSKSLGLLLKQLASNKTHLQMAIQNMSMLDCLISFAIFSNGIYYGSMCKPTILENIAPTIQIEQGYHPYLASLTSEFVANDFFLGEVGNEDQIHIGERTMIITGPNMGGKSTLMRQVAIIVILAQLGCYVPAVTCRLTPVDRIFARLGASFDKPCNGQSTFYVELLETSTLLNHATQNSLVILDELGRGTATYDGMAIAGAVLDYISTKVQCLLLFSTHYHNLVKDLASSTVGSHFKYYQMSFVIDDNSKPFQSCTKDTNKTSIIFLYRLIKGICSSSYGFHVARLTGLSSKIIDCGIIKAKSLEKKFIAKQLLEEMFDLNKDDTINNRSHINIQKIYEYFKNLISI